MEHLIIWIMAVRPKTLPVSMASVVMAGAIALGMKCFSWLPWLLCLVFAVLAQITSNLINDCADFKHGDDCEGRVGPKRVIAERVLSYEAVRKAAVFFAAAASVVGLSLVYWGGWRIIPIGLLIAAAAYGYSAGPFPLSRYALGDIAVVIFYGIIPVVMTCIILGMNFSWHLFWAGFSMGIIVNQLLIINNYRDLEDDAAHGKITTATLFGRDVMRLVYIIAPFVAVYLGSYFLSGISNPLTWNGLGLPFVIYSYVISRKMRRMQGSELNKLILPSALEPVFFALMTLAAVMWH